MPRSGQVPVPGSVSRRSGPQSPPRCSGVGPGNTVLLGGRMAPQGKVALRSREAS